MLKAIWLFTPSRMIRQAIPTAIRSSLTSFENRPGFCRLGRRPVSTRSYTSFFISMDFVIIDHIGQLAKPMSFSRLALVVLVLDSSIMVLGKGSLCFDFRVLGLGEKARAGAE